MTTHQLFIVLALYFGFFTLYTGAMSIAWFARKDEGARVAYMIIALLCAIASAFCTSQVLA